MELKPLLYCQLLLFFARGLSESEQATNSFANSTQLRVEDDDGVATSGNDAKLLRSISSFALESVTSNAGVVAKGASVKAAHSKKIAKLTVLKNSRKSTMCSKKCGSYAIQLYVLSLAHAGFPVATRRWARMEKRVQELSCNNCQNSNIKRFDAPDPTESKVRFPFIPDEGKHLGRHGVFNSNLQTMRHYIKHDAAKRPWLGIIEDDAVIENNFFALVEKKMRAVPSALMIDFDKRNRDCQDLCPFPVCCISAVLYHKSVVHKFLEDAKLSNSTSYLSQYVERHAGKKSPFDWYLHDWAKDSGIPSSSARLVATDDNLSNMNNLVKGDWREGREGSAWMAREARK